MQFSDLVCSLRGGGGHLRVSLFILAAVMLIGSGAAMAGPTTTLVNDVVYRADGTPAAGTLLISWPAFVTSESKPVAAGTMNVPIGTGGALMLALVPNEGATPAGTYYKVLLKLNDGTTSTEYWSVPLATPVKLSQIRSTIMPASVAIQTVSRQYVDATMGAKANDALVLHNTGDEQVSGVKQFSLSPLAPDPTNVLGVANKNYVDIKVASIPTGDFIRKSGDVMVGSLTLAGDPSSTNQAANRHYVDVQVAGVSGTLTQKLGRQGDTPITMAGARYATQFGSIQAAVTDAGTNGTVVIPSDYAGADGFSNPNKVQVVDLRGDASGFRGVYNVKDFGAKPDDNQDDWAAIQAAIDAASAGAGPYGTVFVPRGIYTVSKPLHVTRGITFAGSGRGVTTITGVSADQGPVMVVSPPTSLGYAGIPTGPALATGAGTSLYMDGTFNYMLNLRESGAVELNGRSALTVEFFYKPDITVTAGSYNLIASSGSVTGSDASTSLMILHTATDAISAMLTLGGVQRVVTSPVNSVTKGSVAHIALTYDGSTLRLFINGVLKSSVATSGMITQKMSEDFSLGPRVGGFMESLFDTYMAKGWVDSIRISSVARYTANFTAPTAKFTNDGSTMFLLNFDNNYDQFTTANTMYGTEYLFLRRFGGGMGQVGNFHLRDLSFIGTGPEFIYMVSSMIDNVTVTAARRGIQFINNCYLNRLTSVRAIGQGTTQFGLGIGPASGVLTMSDISVTGGHFPLYMDNSSGSINGLWVEMDPGTEIGAVFRGTVNSSMVIDSPVFSGETMPTTVRYAIAEVGMGSLIMSGGVIENASGTPHVGVFGGGNIVHVGANYSLVGTAPSAVYQIASVPTNPVQLLGAVQQGMNIPWADNLTWMQTSPVKTNQSCTGTDKVSGISGNGSVVCTADQGSGAYTLTLLNTGGNSPANSSTYYFGGDPVDYNNTVFDSAKVEIPKAGTIKRIYIRQNVPSGSTGSAETVTHKVCINTGTNCFGSATISYNGVSTAVTDATLNQPVSVGDTISIRVDTPAWVTKPTNVRWYAVVYIE